MISFIVPTKNEEKYLERTLKCLAGYSGPKEIIVSDGGSSDRTAEIARKYTDKVFVYEGTLRQTIAAGRNMGADQAKGDFIVFLDADVVIPEPDRFFAEAFERFEKDSRLVAIAPCIKVFPEMETVADKIISRGIDFLYIFMNNVIHLAGAGGELQMIRRWAFEKVNGFHEGIVAAEDHELFRRLARIGKTRILSDLFVYHTGRHAHRYGWPKLLWVWFGNYVSVIFRKKAVSTIWEEVR